MQMLQVHGDCVRLSIPSCSFGKVEAAVISGDCRAVAELLTPVEGVAAVDKSMRTTLACTAADRGQSACLRILYKKGINLDGSVSVAAAAAGSLPCLWLAYWHGDLPDWKAIKKAASEGHADCLLFLLKHGCFFESNSVWSELLRSWTLDAAITGGHLACVEVWLAHGPAQDEPYLYSPDICNKELVGVKQLRCLEHLYNKGFPIHPGVLMLAARRGDLEALRFLHNLGVPLWHAAYDEEAEEGDSTCSVRSKPLSRFRRSHMLECRVITGPQIPDDDDSMWAALRYGWVMGAPVTPFMEGMFQAQRAGTRTSLLCFHTAARLSRGEGTCEQRAAFAVMGRMPMELVEKIILLANLEILETIHRRFQSDCSVSVRVCEKPYWWHEGGPIRLYAAPWVDNGECNFW